MFVAIVPHRIPEPIILERDYYGFMPSAPCMDTRTAYSEEAVFTAVPSAKEAILAPMPRKPVRFGADLAEVTGPEVKKLRVLLPKKNVKGLIIYDTEKNHTPQ
jgi:hypothetical protein